MLQGPKSKQGREKAAQGILELARLHKKKCKKRSCDISLMLIGLVYLDLTGKSGFSPEEIEAFS